MTESNYNEAVGRRLRAIRRQRGLSLQDVQRVSNGEFKAAVLGAYERAVSDPCLCPVCRGLSEFYSVPINQMLPQENGSEPAISTVPTGGITIDLNALDRLSGPDAVIFERFLRAVQVMRQDFNGKVLTIRRDDLRTLSLLLEQREEVFTERLTQLGVTPDV